MFNLANSILHTLHLYKMLSVPLAIISTLSELQYLHLTLVCSSLSSTSFSGQSVRLLYAYPSAIPLYLSLFMCISRHLTIPQTSVPLHGHSAQLSGISGNSNIALGIVFDPASLFRQKVLASYTFAINKYSFWLYATISF